MTQIINNQKLFSYKEAAGILGIKMADITKNVGFGKLEIVQPKPNGPLYVTAASLVSFIGHLRAEKALSPKRQGRKPR